MLKFRKKQDKKGKTKLSTGLISSAVFFLVFIIVIFQIYVSSIVIAQSAAANLTDEGRCTSGGCVWNTSNSVCLNDTADMNVSTCVVTTIPLGGLFSRDGIIFIIIMAALIVTIVKTVLVVKVRKD